MLFTRQVDRPHRCEASKVCFKGGVSHRRALNFYLYSFPAPTQSSRAKAERQYSSGRTLDWNRTYPSPWIKTYSTRLARALSANYVVAVGVVDKCLAGMASWRRFSCLRRAKTNAHTWIDRIRTARCKFFSAYKLVISEKSLLRSNISLGAQVLPAPKDPHQPP